MAGVLEGISPHLRLYLHLTMQCNLACRYCYGRDRRSDTMPIEVGRDAIDFFLDRTRHLALQFFGGEPLLQLPMLRALVDHAETAARARGRGLSLVVVTNGTLLGRDAVDFCADHDVDVSLSLDGGPEAQDAGRLFASGRGSFDVVDRNLDHLLARRPGVHVVSVVTPDNAPHLGRSIRFLLARGFRSIAISFDYGDPRLGDAVPEIERQLGVAAEVFLDHVARGERPMIDLFDDGTNPYARGPCAPAERDFSVDPAGRIYPCCCFVDHDRHAFGSIYVGVDAARLAELETARSELVARIAAEHAACPEGAFCRKGCACTNLTATGSPVDIPPVTCALARAVARVQQRLREARAAAAANG